MGAGIDQDTRAEHTVIHIMNTPMKLLCVFSLVNMFVLIHGEMQDIDILGNHIWGRRKARFQAVVTLDVSPAIPHPEKPALSITFDAPVKGIKVYQFDVDTMNEDKTSADLTYKYEEASMKETLLSIFRLNAQVKKTLVLLRWIIVLYL